LKSKLFRLFILACIGLVSISSIYANGPKDYITKDSFIYGSYHRGMLIGHHGCINYYNEEFINGFDLRLGRSFPEIRNVRSPEIGVGIYHSNLGNADIYGNTTGLYFHFSSSFLNQSQPFGFGTTVSSGINYVSTPYDKENNFINQAIGSHLNAFFILQLDFEYSINNDLLFNLSPSLVHMSNGKVKLPNAGLNLYNIQLGAKHVIDSKKFDKTNHSYSANQTEGKKHRISALSAAAVRQKSLMANETEFISSSLLEYSYKLTPHLRLGAGSNLFYISNFLMAPTTVHHEYEYNKFTGGLHFSCEIVWNKLSFILQPGIRVFHNNPNDRFHFSRVGIRYNPLSDFFVNCSIKSSSFVAEYIEWGIGYNLNF